MSLADFIAANHAEEWVVITDRDMPGILRREFLRNQKMITEGAAAPEEQPAAEPRVSHPEEQPSEPVRPPKHSPPSPVQLPQSSPLVEEVLETPPPGLSAPSCPPDVPAENGVHSRPTNGDLVDLQLAQDVQTQCQNLGYGVS